MNVANRRVFRDVQTPVTLIPTLALAAAVAAAPIFRFETDEFWLNLHHFLYVLGRAEASVPDAQREAVRGAPGEAVRVLASLGDAERAVWRDAVRAYAAGPSRQDAVFDEQLTATARALATVGETAEPAGPGIDPQIAAALKQAAPIYRRAFWPAHRKANRAFRTSTQALVDRHGRAVLDFITRTYGMRWPPEGYPVHISAYANWAGAYSTSGNLLVVSSLQPDAGGSQALETVFHEAMHQWDDAMFALLREQAVKIGKQFPGGLSHALIFYTAGDAVRRQVPGHVPGGEVAGVWDRGMRPFRSALVEIWQPYLDGRGTRDETLTALVARTAVDPKREP